MHFPFNGVKRITHTRNLPYDTGVFSQQNMASKNDALSLNTEALAITPKGGLSGKKCFAAESSLKEASGELLFLPV